MTEVYLVGFNTQLNKETGEMQKIAVVSRGVNGKTIPHKVITVEKDVEVLHDKLSKMNMEV